MSGGQSTGMMFDGQWTFYLPSSTVGTSTQLSSAQFPFLTNGTVGIVPSIDGTTPISAGVDSSVSVLSGCSYAIPAFQFSRVRVSINGTELDQQLTSSTTFPTSLQLDIQNGVFSLWGIDSSTGCAVQHDFRALLQFPGMILHSVQVTVPASSSSPSAVTATLLHEVRPPNPYTPSGNIRFSGDTIYVPSGTPQFVLSAENESQACISVYFPQTPLSSAASYNETLAGPGRPRKAYAILPMTKTSTTHAATVFIAHVLTAVVPISSTKQAEAVKRRLLGLTTIASTPFLSVLALVEGHEAAWAAKWNTYVDIPGAGNTVKMALKSAFYNLHSCIRPMTSSYFGYPDSPPAYLDIAGTTLGAAGRGDDFLVNALLFMSPGAAKALLEERWKNLPDGMKTAAEEGLEGARFPYANEPSSSYSSSSSAFPASTAPPGDGNDPQDGSIVVAQDDPWQDGPSAASSLWPSAPSAGRIYGTLMAAVDAWNYFRVSKDVDWLADRGWVLLRAAADLVCSLAAPFVPPTSSVILSDPPTIPLVGSMYVGVVGMDVSRSPAINPAAVVAAAVAALRGAVEASYALGYKYPSVPLWNAVRYGLVLTTVTPSGYSPVLSSDASTNGLGPLRIPETILPLLEPLKSLSSSLANSTTLLDNYNYWFKSEPTAGTNASPRDVAIGDFLMLQTLARLSQATASGSLLTESFFETIVSRHVDISGFGNFRPAGGLPYAPNDLTLAAMYVLVFVQGLAGGVVSGGYTSSQLTYAPLGISTAASAVLPIGWDQMVLYGIGQQQIDAVLLNGSVGASGTAGTFVPWSVNNFV